MLNRKLDLLYWVFKHTKKLDLFYYFYKIIKYRNVAKAQEMFYWKNQLKYSPEVFSCGDLYHREDDISFALKSIESTFNVSGKNIKVLEIGPGPKSNLIPWYDKGVFDLIGVDPLANDYKRELDGGSFLLSGLGEEVDTLFSHNSFHMVYSSNALDHCQDPHKVVAGVFQVLKPQGLFIVCGNEREGSRVFWQGFHQHDLWLESNNLLHSDKNKNISILIDDEEFSLVNKRDLIYDWQGNKIKWFLGTWKKGSLKYFKK